MRWGSSRVRRRWRRALLVAALLAAPSGDAGAACNNVPLPPGTFAGTKGVVDRPFSVPGRTVAIGLRTCDGTSFASQPQDHTITIAFPGTGTTRNLVVVTAGSCPPTNVCQAAGASAVGCVSVGTGVGGLQFVQGGTRLGFPFPDSSRPLGASGDDHALSGPAAIAVTRAPAVACGLATASCASQTGLVACVDTLFEYEGDTTCGTTSNTIFSQFTALPPANRFVTECRDSSPPCTPTQPVPRHEIGFAVDTVGNLLIPLEWQGITPSAPQLKRMVRGFGRHWSDDVRLPSTDFVSSYSPEGVVLYPFLDVAPMARPAEIAGSVDSPSYTVLRIARPVGKCKGGAKNGTVCQGHCPGAVCEPKCADGSDCGSGCATGTCGRLFDFQPRAEGGIGPVVFRRPSDMLVCRRAHTVCMSFRQCRSDDACEAYALEADAQPLPLAPLVQTTTLLAFAVNEQVDGLDRNGDGDARDVVLAVRDRATRRAIGIGGGPGRCGIGPRAAARAVVDAGDIPAVAAEGDVLAFLESEAGQGTCDENGDASTNDAILRVFTVDASKATEHTASANIAVDPAPVVNRQSLAVSGDRVFYRARGEAGAVPVLEVLDVPHAPGTKASSGPRPLVLGPATVVAVAGGRTAFVGPDRRVHLWTGGTEVERAFERPAEGVALSPGWIAALVPVGGRREVAVSPVDRASWKDLGQTADTVAVAGSLVVFVTPERELRLYHADSGKLVNGGKHVDDLVLDEGRAARDDPRFVAFRRNGVLQVYDVANDTLVDTGEAATPCPSPTCDPRSPYRLVGTQLRFLAPDGSATVVKVFDVPTRRTTQLAQIALGETTPYADPLADDGGSLLFPSRAGRCVPPAARRLSSEACPAGTFADPTLDTCVLDLPSLCLEDAGCPGGATCMRQTVAVAVAVTDGDGDGIPDGVDARPVAPDALGPLHRRERRCWLGSLFPWCRERQRGAREH
ncbi:MAG: hypothetical protein ACREQL_07975 [Candidatus Binatia bacterium]